MTCLLPLAIGSFLWVGLSADGMQATGRAHDAYTRAIELEAKGNYPAALSLLWEAAGLAPRDPDIQNRLGEGLERMGALDAAIDAYRQAVTERAAFRKARNNLVLALVKAGRGPEAVERARALVAAAPDDPERYFTLGLAQSEQDVGEAIHAFRRVLEIAPRHALARYNLALVLKRADRLSEALEELQRAREIEPRPEISYTEGVIHLHRGDLDRAASALRAAIASEPGYADAYATLGAVLKARRDFAGAADALRRAVSLRPQVAATHSALGQVLQLNGEERGAQSELAEAARLSEQARIEQEASTWTAVGSQKLDRGDPAGAVECFQRAIALLDVYAPAYYQLGRALQRQGQIDAARAAFGRAQQLNPSLVPPR